MKAMKMMMIITFKQGLFCDETKKKFYLFIIIIFVFSDTTGGERDLKHFIALNESCISNEMLKLLNQFVSARQKK